MDFGQITSCDPSWATLSGTTLPGGYEVGDMLAADAQQAKFRLRVLGDWSARASLHAFCLPGTEAQQQIAVWTAAQRLLHPNVSSPVASGEWEHKGSQLTYVVVSRPDETLAGLLRERPVTSAEAREIVASVCRALAYLHANGWVHAHLSPEQVLAFGDAIRISSEYVVQINAARIVELTAADYIAPEASGSNTTPAADVWCLGTTLFEALTQEPFSADQSAKIAQLPAPFDRIVARCLNPDPLARCTLTEAQDLTSHRRTTSVPAPVPPPVAPPPPQMPQNVAAPALLRVAPRQKQTQNNSPKLWIYAVCALALVFLLLWFARPRHQYAPAKTPVAMLQQSSPVTPVPPPNSAGQTPPLLRPDLPQRANSTFAAQAGKAVEPDSSTINGPVWRVIVFTYSREADAEQKAQSINRKHSNLNAKVFSPAGNGSLYLVTVGGTMSREEANRLRRQAVGLGLPHDSYIQNYRQ